MSKHYGKPIHGPYFTKEMAEVIIEKYRLHKERNIDPSTGLAKEKAPLFDYTSFAAALFMARAKKLDPIHCFSLQREQYKMDVLSNFMREQGYA